MGDLNRRVTLQRRDSFRVVRDPGGTGKRGIADLFYVDFSLLIVDRGQKSPIKQHTNRVNPVNARNVRGRSQRKRGVSQ